MGRTESSCSHKSLVALRLLATQQNGTVWGSTAESPRVAANWSIAVLTDPDGRGLTVTVEIFSTERKTGGSLPSESMTRFSPHATDGTISLDRYRLFTAEK
jgi:hypothetical protein